METAGISTLPSDPCSVQPILQHHNADALARWDTASRGHPRQGSSAPVIQIEVEYAVSLTELRSRMSACHLYR